MLHGIDRMARRIAQSADRLRLPERDRPTATSAPDPTKPALVRGRGLARRRPRSPLSSPLAWLLGLLVLAGLALVIF